MASIPHNTLILSLLLCVGAGLPANLQGAPGVIPPVPESRHAPSEPGGSAVISGRVIDPSGAVVPAALVTVLTADGTARETRTDPAGRFSVPGLPPGEQRVIVSSAGFAAGEVPVETGVGTLATVEIRLEVGNFTEALQVMPQRLIDGPEAARRIPGSFTVLDLRALESSRVFTTSEALKKAAGVFVREEEGFGLRPNIGIRGLNPTRSSRVLLLEDGIPLTYAPYGDNASYYHPPIERFDSIELLKGSGQIAYGPMTVGGVINYITPVPPARSRGTAVLSAGNRGYFNGHGNYGSTVGGTGFLVDFLRKQGDGARENVHSELHDVSGKVVRRLTARQVVTARGSYYQEDSNVTYSGLRQDEYLANPRQNPFKNDSFNSDRFGSSATHNYTISDSLVLTTNAYVSSFKRHWWRQSSNSGQRPNDASDPACGGMANLDTTCGNEGRLRQYWVWGVEPRARASFRTGAAWNEMDIGVRLHLEDQERRQENGDTPLARTGRLVENNERQNRAVAAFMQNRFLLGDWAITPGLRLERVGYERTNRLTSVSGRTDLTKVIPGIGVSHNPRRDLTIFAGAHRGFAPPRTEDIINNATGGVVDLDPELSWNYEVGFRGAPRAGVQFDAAFFRMDYENQIVPASLAGGVGATLTNGGSTLQQGFEGTVRLDSTGLWNTRHNVFVRSAFTAVPTARFTGTRFSNVSGFGSVSVSGNRLPYAPEWMLNASAGYNHAAGLDLALEVVTVSEQYGDDLNTIQPTPDGQRGLIPRHAVWNAAANYRLRPGNVTLFITAKNLLDRTFIVDRSRGIIPGIPRLVQAGAKVTF
jgi:Fe(3+) dicitrate transport protein